jgi:hypothetical protein
MHTTDEDRARRDLLIASVVTVGLLYLLVRIVVRWPQQSFAVVTSAVIAGAWTYWTT